MSSTEPAAPAFDFTAEMRAGWEAALTELTHQAAHLEARGSLRAAVTLYDAIRIARSGGLRCEHPPRPWMRVAQS
jgi:triphosphoribosyl-dephospho-CoA synthetase